MAFAYYFALSIPKAGREGNFSFGMAQLVVGTPCKTEAEGGG